MLHIHTTTKAVITHTFSHGDLQLLCSLMLPKRQWVANFSGQNAEGRAISNRGKTGLKNGVWVIIGSTVRPILKCN